MAQLKLNGLDFKELGNNSIEDVLNDAIKDIIKRTNKVIIDRVKETPKNSPMAVPGFRDFYEALDYNKDTSDPCVTANVEINSKNVNLKRPFYTDYTKIMFNTHAEGGLQDRVCTEDEAEEIDIMRRFVCEDKDWTSIWQGELPFIYIYVARVGNKEYSFYTVSR